MLAASFDTIGACARHPCLPAWDADTPVPETDRQIFDTMADLVFPIDCTLRCQTCGNGTLWSQGSAAFRCGLSPVDSLSAWSKVLPVNKRQHYRTGCRQRCAESPHASLCAQAAVRSARRFSHQGGRRVLRGCKRCIAQGSQRMNIEPMNGTCSRVRGRIRFPFSPHQSPAVLQLPGGP
jgi:hypothetical protein